MRRRPILVSTSPTAARSCSRTVSEFHESDAPADSLGTKKAGGHGPSAFSALTCSAVVPSPSVAHLLGGPIRASRSDTAGQFEASLLKAGFSFDWYGR